MTPHDTPAQGAELVEAACRALCKSEGTAQCAPLCLSFLSSQTADGRCPEAKLVWERKARAALAAAQAEIEELRALARRLSNALLEARPLGGSEMFISAVGDHYADPDLCAQIIGKLRHDIHESKITAARAKTYAHGLAVAIYNKHWKDASEWKSLDDLVGLLTQIDNMTSGLVSESSLTAAQAEIEELRAEIANREARRIEILDFLQHEIGTAWDCAHCGYSTYHAFNKECANCGEDFPFLNLLAFKLHASHTEASPIPSAQAETRDAREDTREWKALANDCGEKLEAAKARIATLESSLSTALREKDDWENAYQMLDIQSSAALSTVKGETLEEAAKVIDDRCAEVLSDAAQASDGRSSAAAPVLFLDVDGVLNNEAAFREPDRESAPLCLHALARLHRLIADTKCHIVLSSAWRDMEGLEAKLAAAGVFYRAHKDKRTIHLHWERDPETNKVIKETCRGDEIAEWLSRHPEVTSYAIVDDDSDMLPEQLPFFVHTNFKTGLLDEHVDRLSALLRPAIEERPSIALGEKSNVTCESEQSPSVGEEGQ